MDSNVYNFFEFSVIFLGKRILGYKLNCSISEMYILYKMFFR